MYNMAVHSKALFTQYPTETSIYIGLTLFRTLMYNIFLLQYARRKFLRWIVNMKSKLKTVGKNMFILCQKIMSHTEFIIVYRSF